MRCAVPVAATRASEARRLLVLLEALSAGLSGKASNSRLPITSSRRVMVARQRSSLTSR